MRSAQQGHCATYDAIVIAGSRAWEEIGQSRTKQEEGRESLKLFASELAKVSNDDLALEGGIGFQFAGQRVMDSPECRLILPVQPQSLLNETDGLEMPIEGSTGAIVSHTESYCRHVCGERTQTGDPRLLETSVEKGLPREDRCYVHCG